MKTHSQQLAALSHTIQSKPKAAKQADMHTVLQKYAVAQRVETPDEDEDPLQGKFSGTVQREATPPLGVGELPSRGEGTNQTGIPDGIKTNFENLSGFSFDDVRVHYNSDKPAQLQALAYTQGNEVHIAPGQEKHLGHELGHVVQQKQGRVQPTMQLQGVNVNDNEGLEKEADAMGGKVVQMRNGKELFEKGKSVQMMTNGEVIQRLKWVEVDRSYKVFDSIGKYHVPDDEEMDNFPGSDVWRPGTVWDDDDKKWYEIDGAELVERVEDIRITPFTCENYSEISDGGKTIFGHKIAFTTWFKGQEIKWEEKTNEPYDLVYVKMEKDTWIDLYKELKEKSNVFAYAQNIDTGKYKGYSFSDPPGIFKESNRNRTLEFKISFTDVSGSTKIINATQILRTDENGDITEQSFNWNIR